MNEGPTLVGTYDYRLVILSVSIAVLAAYASLDLAGRIVSYRGRVRVLWLAGGASAMGFGIWSMHYVGMLAYTLPVEVRYDWPTVLISLLAAVSASSVALFIVSRDALLPTRTVISGILMGAGIAAMHYIGMEAMRLRAMCHYSLPMVGLSVVLAVTISLVAIWLTFRLRNQTSAVSFRKIGTALVMGLAIPIMHYTGMFAVTFTSMNVNPDVSHSLRISDLGVAAIILVTITILGLTILAALLDRRFSRQASELSLSEQRLRE
jgi:NO-binding membrane sensor protein with MHYT domain